MNHKLLSKLISLSVALCFAFGVAVTMSNGMDVYSGSNSAYILSGSADAEYQMPNPFGVWSSTEWTL